MLRGLSLTHHSWLCPRDLHGWFPIATEPNGNGFEEGLEYPDLAVTFLPDKAEVREFNEVPLDARVV